MQLPLRGVNGRSLMRLLPFTREQGKKDGEEARDDALETASSRIAALCLAASCIAHLAFLTPAFIYGGSPFHTPPADAITVDLVPGADVPQTADTPPANPAPDKIPDKDTPAKETPVEKPPSAKETDASTTSPPAAPASPLPPPSPAAQAVAVTPSAPPPLPFMALPAQPPPAEPPQSPEHDDSNAGDVFAMPLTMPDGTVGGGTFGQQAADQADVTKDVAAAFFNHIRTCATRPAGLPEGVRVVVRIYLKPDGTLATDVPANPEPLKVSMGGGELFVNAVAALKKCQPYTMLPPDRYPEWRMLDLTFTPQNF